MCHQYMPKIFHGPHKNPPDPAPTYLMYSPLFAIKLLADLIFLNVSSILPSFAQCTTITSSKEALKLCNAFFNSRIKTILLVQLQLS